MFVLKNHYAPQLGETQCHGVSHSNQLLKTYSSNDVCCHFVQCQNDIFSGHTKNPQND